MEDHSSMCKDLDVDDILCLDVQKSTKFQFTEDHMNLLVAERIKMDNLFKKKSVDNNELWLKILANIGLSDKCDVATVKKRYDNCQQRYKRWKNPGTGEGNEGLKRAKHKQPEYIQMLDDFNSESHCFNPIKRVDTEDINIAPFVTPVQHIASNSDINIASSSPLDTSEDNIQSQASDTDSNLKRGLSSSQQPRKKKRTMRSHDELIQLAKKHDERNGDFQEKVLERLDELGTLMRIFLNKSLKKNITASQTDVSDDSDVRVVSGYENMIRDLNLK